MAIVVFFHPLSSTSFPISKEVIAQGEKKVSEVKEQKVKKTYEKREFKIKYNHTVKSIQLSLYKVLLPNPSSLEFNSMIQRNTYVDNSVIENNRGIRCYHSIDYFEDYSTNAFHSLPQIVFSLTLF